MAFLEHLTPRPSPEEAELGQAADMHAPVAEVVPLRGPQALPQPMPQLMADESTEVDSRRPRSRRRFLRVHAIEGEIAKIYPVDVGRLGHGVLARVVNLKKVDNIYVENEKLSRQLRGDQNTLWHLLVSQVAAGTSKVRPA